MTAPVSDAAARLDWQQRANEVVDRLLDAAVEHGLPPLSWTVGRNCALTGGVDGPGLSTDRERQAAFDAWAAHLDVVPDAGLSHLGRPRLLAPFTIDGVNGRILAFIAGEGAA